MKIVSLVPSLTEILFDFGIDPKNIVGRTKFCIHPDNKVKNIEIMGGTKNINIKKVISLKPDLILANKEENLKLQVEELMNNHNVLLTDVVTLDDNYKLLETLGKILNREEIAKHYILKIKKQFDFRRKLKNNKVAYLIWKDPYMTIGNDTFIHHILLELGLENICSHQTRYPEINTEDLDAADYIFLSSEPYPFKEKHMAELSKKYPRKKIVLVDGEAFSWYGTRIANIENYFQNLIQELENYSISKP